MPRLLFVNRVCWPEEAATAQLLINLADGLAQLDWDCHIISGSKGGPERAGNRLTFHQPNGRGVQTSRGLIAKAIAYRQFTNAVIRFLPNFIMPGDRVIAMTDPPLIGTKIAPTVQRHEAHLWHWVQDVYPEVAIALSQNALVRMAFRTLIGSRNRAWSAAEQIVPIGQDMADLIRQQTGPDASIDIIPNWYPAAVEPEVATNFRERWQIGHQMLLVIYSGNLGRAHILSPMLDIAEKCEAAGISIHFAFVGDGAQKDRLILEVKERGLTNISFQPPVPRDELDSLLQAADIHFVSMRPECRGTVLPSKFYGIMAAGRPCIFIGPQNGDLPELIRSHNLGIACEPFEIGPAVDYHTRLVSNPDVAEESCRSVKKYQTSLPNATDS